jgi:hypothetical protein
MINDIKEIKKYKTKLYAIVSDATGIINVLCAPTYKELRKLIEDQGECEVKEILRGRSIPFRIETQLRFFK